MTDMALKLFGCELLEVPFRAFCPSEINLAMLCDAISQIEVDQALIRNAGFLGHVFEVFDDILSHANGDLLLKF